VSDGCPCADHERIERSGEYQGHGERKERKRRKRTGQKEGKRRKVDWSDEHEVTIVIEQPTWV
jgi:hypothetical protein